MLVLGVKPGHDGAVVVVKDGQLLWSLEAEKDSNPRHAPLTPMTIFEALELMGAAPDIVAIGGWEKDDAEAGHQLEILTGYRGAHTTSLREAKIWGRRTKVFSSTHVRSHIMMGAGMAPPDDADLRAVLVWEGAEGSFYLLDGGFNVVREIPVLQFPGGRYAFVYGLAAPWYADSTRAPDGDESGKLMALAAYANSADADGDVARTVEEILAPDSYGRQKGFYGDAPLYNAGVEAKATKLAAALIQDRIFEIFAEVAQDQIPSDIPLYISGGCGLNCDWNTMWRELGHFSSVFVPPCTNDSGSALGTALDALHAVTGDPRVEWDVYCGLDFEWDRDPRPWIWRRRRLELPALADAIAEGRIVAWVQGRYEMGPRALGNRSLLAEPFDPRTKDRLNAIKARERYRPIAPVCRIEDAGRLFDRDFHDPHMLYFRKVTTPELGAVTHVDGSVRCQTVTEESNRKLHELLSTFAESHGAGVLCNTSLNYKGMGFINRMSDLEHYCDTNGVHDFVVGDAWFWREESRDEARLRMPIRDAAQVLGSDGLRAAVSLVG
jgi:hydroxymethyl cephem carbamoyltransferase